MLSGKGQEMIVIRRDISYGVNNQFGMPSATFGTENKLNHQMQRENETQYFDTYVKVNELDPDIYSDVVKGVNIESGSYVRILKICVSGL